MKINFASISQRGKRAVNQDTCLSKQLTSDIYIFAVADGMGGVAGGERASEIVISVLENSIVSSLDQIYDFEDGVTLAFQKAISDIQEAIAHDVRDQSEFQGMGSTLTAMLIVGNTYAYCNIGDSRLYSFSESGLKVLTIDHSYVQEILSQKDLAELTDEFLQRHDNIITRVLNGGEDVADHYSVQNLDFTQTSFIAFLLCSDGLILEKRKDPDYIARILSESRDDLEEDCLKLSNHAYENGSTDNITCILVRVDQEQQTF